MPRPRTPLGTYGTVSLMEVAPGKWRARTRFRFEDGKLRQVEKFAPTKAKAETALKRALTEAAATSGGDVKRETRIRDLSTRYLQSKAHLKPRSVDTYRQTLNHIILPRMGDLAVAEATPDRLQRHLDAIRAEHGPGAAKVSRAVLSGMLGLATRSGAVRANPVRELERVPTAGTGGATAIPLDELGKLLEAVRDDERLKDLDFVGIVEFLAGTGARISEVLALQWDDVDLEAGTVTIRANTVRARGRGLVRQEATKTKAGQRTIAVPASLVGVLGDRRIRATGDLVFPTVLGNMWDPRLASRTWAEARVRVGFPTVTTHSFRKTVATALDRAGLSARDIAEYLGHANPSLTQDVYMAKAIGGTRAAGALDGLLGHR